MDQIQGTFYRPLNRFLRRPEVERTTGLGRSTIYKKMEDGTFPKTVPISGGAVGWLASEIEEWMAARVGERDSAEALELKRRSRGG